MSTYNKKVGKGKLGINLIKSFADENDCYFHEIVQENDVGIDAFIEFTKDSENTGLCIAVQIKNGNSFFNKDKTKCKIPINNHYKYWKNHSLDVYGIVCDYDRKVAFWVSITDYLEDNKENIESNKLKNIIFPTMKINELNSRTFATIFKMLIYGLLPVLSFEQTIELSQSKFIKEKKLAIELFMRKYVDNTKSWDICFNMLKNEQDINLLINLIVYLSYVPHHPDLWNDLKYCDKTKEYAKNLIKTIDKKTIVKMLNVISDDDYIGRGTIGQSIESIISILPNNKNTLIQIIDENCDNDIGIRAFQILAYYDTDLILERKKYFENILGEYAKTVIDYIQEFHHYDLYS